MAVTDPLERIEVKIDRIDAKIDHNITHIASINLTLARQADQLTEHIRRTEALEKAVIPLTTAHSAWIGVGKALTIVGAALGVLAGLSKFLH